MKMRKKKKVPSFWWDFGDSEIIVESDSGKYPVVARFEFNPKDGQGCAMEAIEKAEKYIGDLKAGRETPKSC
jgi:hypothetical protein